uniref:DUF7705 domain-containing protein n=1 Tax=Setaria viridis TaxID=4556 RepID=A0A4U6V2Y8_SETVI|nr:hypothetical protein SEVIR_4G182200v2 [Setaria viridis]
MTGMPQQDLNRFDRSQGVLPWSSLSRKRIQPHTILSAGEHAVTDVDRYTAAKELYLGNRCQVSDNPAPWQFWMIMLKNGNLDTMAAICPENGRPACPFPHPLVFHDRTLLDDAGRLLRGGGGWVFHHKLRTSKKYAWLMLYLRSDATSGFSGGYHYDTRGMTKIVPESPDFKVRVTLEVKQGGGPNSQFYLVGMSSCWKNDGRPEMIINPGKPAWCGPSRIEQRPPWHTFRNGTRVHRTDTTRFPYDAYHVYCSPGNTRRAEQPTTYCDAYSNPQAQEILQLVPHPVWDEFGYAPHGQGGYRAWELDVGALSHSLQFYQDPGTPPAKRRWTSLDVGTEIYVSEKAEDEWTLSGFDIIVLNICIKSQQG